MGLCPEGNITLTCTTCNEYNVLAWDSPVIPDSPGALVFSLASEVGDVAALGSLQAILVNKTAGCFTSNLTVTASTPVVNGTEISCKGAINTVKNWTVIILGEYAILYMPVSTLCCIDILSPIPIPTQNPSTDTLTSTTIEWSVPGDSGADITSYTITYTSESGEGVESVDGSATSALLTGLTPNVDYEANITASNCAGTSEPTAFSFRIQGTGKWYNCCL